MEEEGRHQTSIKEEKLCSSTASKSSLDKSKHQDPTGSDDFLKNNPRMISTLSESNFSASNIVTKKKFRHQLQKQVDPKYYKQETGIVKIHPENDHREVVIDTTKYPFSSHGRVVMTFDGNAAYGSGTLISSRLVLTAAHNLYPRYFSKEPESILFIPALNGEECPFGIIRIQRYFYPQEFRDTKLEDYAMLELEEDIGAIKDFIQMKEHSAKDIDSKEYFIYGYPKYVYNQIANDNDYLYGMSGEVSHIESKNVLRYHIDTEPGQSGASIYHKSPEGSKYVTIGVHVSGNAVKGYNTGTFLTSERINRLQEWINLNTFNAKHNLAQLTSEVHGRDLEMNSMRDYFRKDGKFGVIGLSGIPGVGKSTLALKFATECRGSYDYIWWIDSETEDTFKGSILALADSLQIVGKTFQEKLNKLKVILNEKETRFLMIFDNLEDDNISKSILATRGHYLITTRLEKPDFEIIKVNTLSTEASVKVLESQLPDRKREDLVTLANFLDNLPLALIQSAVSIREHKIDVMEYIGQFSNMMNIDDKLKNIVSRNIESLSENSQHILKIVCIGYCENIPYGMLYKVFCYTHPGTEEFEFNIDMFDILRFSILSYDNQKELFRIHRVIQEACASKLGSISDELMSHYSDYLYHNYDVKPNIYTTERVDPMKSLTLHSVEFLKRYKASILPTKDILLYARISWSYMQLFLDYDTSMKYILNTKQLLREELGNDSDLAEIYSLLGALYYYHGDYERSLELSLKCKDIREAILPENHPNLAEIYNNIGIVYNFYEEYDKCEEYYYKCLKIREANKDNLLALAHIFNNIGELADSKCDYQMSEDCFTTSLDIREKMLDENHPDLAQSYNNLGALYDTLKDYDKSEMNYLKSKTIYEKIRPKDHPDLGMIYNNLGALYERKLDYKLSEEYYMKCIAIYETTLPKDHIDIATLYYRLGMIYFKLADYIRSEDYMLKCLYIREIKLGPNHSDLGRIYNNLGEMYRYMEKFDKSKEYFYKCILILESSSHNKPELAGLYGNLGNLYKDMGKYQKSEDYYLISLSIIENISPYSDKIAETCNNLGLLYYNMADYTNCEDCWLRSQEIWDPILSSTHPTRGTLYNNLGMLYQEKREFEKCEEYYLKSLEITKSSLPSNHPELALTYINLGELYKSIGKFAQSEENYKKSLSIIQSNIPQNELTKAIIYNNLGALHEANQDYPKSKKYYLRCLEIRKNILEANHPDMALIYNNLGVLSYRMRDHIASLEYLKQCYDIWKRIYPQNHPMIISILTNIQVVCSAYEEENRRP